MSPISITRKAGILSSACEPMPARGTGAVVRRDRFDALDSLRGICALMVVLFHFPTNSLLTDATLIRHSWMFVDFFFVLSGFVITHAYWERLGRGDIGLGRFMALRLGRIYPLHLTMLFAMVMLEAVKLLGFGSERMPFTGHNTVSSIFSNLFLLQSFGVEHQLTWNGPSWSIAAEMWTYLVFAAVFGFLGHRARGAFVILGLLSLLLLVTYSSSLDTTFELGFVRCLLGFSLGVGVQGFFVTGRRIGGTWPEIAVMIGVLIFVAADPGPQVQFAAPGLFAAVVLIFAGEEGAVSRMLCTRPLLMLGTLSYSLYMVHGFVQERVLAVLKHAGGRFGIIVGERVTAPPVVADFLVLGMFAAVVVTAFVTYRLVELPAREWTRAKLNGPGRKRLA